jgi:hypothetical protein
VSVLVDGFWKRLRFYGYVSVFGEESEPEEAEVSIKVFYNNLFILAMINLRLLI